MKKHNKNVPAKLMEAVARRSAEIATDSRCVYLFHQPKQPNGIKTNNATPKTLGIKNHHLFCQIDFNFLNNRITSFIDTHVPF